MFTKFTSRSTSEIVLLIFSEVKLVTSQAQSFLTQKCLESPICLLYYLAEVPNTRKYQLV